MINVSIIGVGLIGGSLGLALRNKGYRVTGVGRNLSRLKAAKALGAADFVTTDLKTGTEKADIVVICLPVNLTAKTVKDIAPFLKPGAVITDAGSTKEEVLKGVSSVVRRPGGKIFFVGGHPLAGSEKSGVSAAKADLFRGASVVISGTKGVPRDKAGLVENMWKKAGAVIVRMEAAEHDRAVSATSHLPHIIAFCECLLVNDLDRKDGRVKRLLAGSFKDMTRIADSNPADWAVICSSNRRELSNSLEAFIKRLKEAKKNLGNSGKLEKMFSRAKTARQKLLNI